MAAIRYRDKVNREHVIKVFDLDSALKDIKAAGGKVLCYVTSDIDTWVSFWGGETA